MGWGGGGGGGGVVREWGGGVPDIPTPWVCTSVLKMQN